MLTERLFSLNPDATSLAVGKSKVHDGEWTYSRFNLLVTKIRAVLRAHTPGPVGILAQRSAWAYAAVMACLHEGRVLIPLNPRWPLARLNAITTEIDTSLVLFEDRYAPLAAEIEKRRSLQEIAQRSEADVFEPLKIQDSAIAYVLFTSGSTGAPKGIEVTRGNLDAFLNGINLEFVTHSRDRFSQAYDLSFDLGLGEVIWALTIGASLHPLEPAEMPFLDAYLVRSRPTVWSSTPSMVQILAKYSQLNGPTAESIRLSLFCGERLTDATARIWKRKASGSAIFNLYGPTETTIYLTKYEWNGTSAESDHGVLIGKPLPRSEVLIVDDVQAVTTEGELWIGGPQVAAGYWNRPDLTAKAFVERDGRRWYRSGDWVHRTESGDLQFIGRRDMQVKIHGHRIELGEIEAVVAREFPEVTACALVFEKDGLNEIALVILGSFNEAATRESLRKSLPTYAVPKTILRVDEWPLNPHGKLDRNALLAKLKL